MGPYRGLYWTSARPQSQISDRSYWILGPYRTTPDVKLAERAGFEPARSKAPTRFPVAPIRPLWHLSSANIHYRFSSFLVSTRPRQIPGSFDNRLRREYPVKVDGRLLPVCHASDSRNSLGTGPRSFSWAGEAPYRERRHMPYNVQRLN